VKFRLIALVIAVLVVVATVAGVFIWRAKQPDSKLGSSTIEFDASERPGKRRPRQPKKIEELPWLTFGYDEARTHFAPDYRHRPPFKRSWMVKAGHYIEFPAVVADGRVFVAQEKGRFFAIDAKTGDILWDRQYDKCAASSPTYRDGVVYQAFLPDCPYGPRNVPGLLVAFDAETGKELWRFTETGPSESSLLIVGNLLYFGSWDRQMYALDLRTRKIKWATEVDDEIYSSPAYSRGRIFIGTQGGSIYAMNAKTGNVLWRGRSYTHFPRGREYFYATPTAAYGRVFAGNTDGWVYAYGAKTGNLLWAQRAGTYVYTAPAVWANTVYVGSYDGNVYAFDAGTGELRWKYAASGSIHGAPTVMAGLVYFSVCGRCGHAGSRYAKMGQPGTFALDAKTGELVWSFFDGRYSPVIADETHVYLMGKSRVWAFEPCPQRRTPDGTYRNLIRSCEPAQRAARAQPRSQQGARSDTRSGRRG
jgi:outer membrane protein assembly factor BamB